MRIDDNQCLLVGIQLSGRGHITNTDGGLCMAGTRSDRQSGALNVDWLQEAIHGPTAGGIYLLAGQPGIGKSTLSLQIAAARAAVGRPTLYALTEQSPDEARNRLLGMLTACGIDRHDEVLRFIRFDETDTSVQSLTRTWTRGRTWAVNQTNTELDLIILDSVQGQGLSGNAKDYKVLLNLCRELKQDNIATVLLSHITKDGNIAGPRALEHAVDCVLVMRKAMSYRPLFITKNRYGRTPDRPLPLILDKNTTTLIPSPYRDKMIASAQAIIPCASDIVEAQVNVTLPSSLGQNGSIQTVGVPKKIIQQLLSSIASIIDSDLSDLDFKIQCNVPGAYRYSQYICLAMAIAIIGSYLRREVLPCFYFVGEVDLQGKIRPISRDLHDPHAYRDSWPALTHMVGVGTEMFVFCAKQSAAALKDVHPRVSFVGCESVEEVMDIIWPDNSTE